MDIFKNIDPSQFESLEPLKKHWNYREPQAYRPTALFHDLIRFDFR